MPSTPTLIQVQDEYIAKLHHYRANPMRRTNAMLTTKAGNAMFRKLLALGLTYDQANQAKNDAQDVYQLQVNANA